jgi:GxxExxY protein
VRDLDEITEAMVDAALRMHRDLGSSLMESVYEAVPARALAQQGFRVERQKVIHFEYRGMVSEEGLRVDIVVDDRLIVEVKSVQHLARQHVKQLLTYLRLTNRHVGLLIIFGAPTLREGLKREVNPFQPLRVSAAPRE